MRSRRARSDPTRRFAAPDCPPGWRTGPPDFVGVGVQRAGTTWWYRALEQHPGVARVQGAPKELHFFGAAWQEGLLDDLIERYHRMFPRPPGAITGEWTPRYMYDVWSLRLLRSAAPRARILILLRDPVERYLSGVAWHRRLAAGEDGSLTLIKFDDAVARGLYAWQLERVFAHFPREQVLVLQYERCLQDPETAMARTCAFLGLEPFEQPPSALEPKPASRRERSLAEPMHAELVGRLDQDVRRLTRLCPEIDLALWPNFRHLAGSGS